MFFAECDQFAEHARDRSPADVRRGMRPETPKLLVHKQERVQFRVHEFRRRKNDGVHARLEARRLGRALDRNGEPLVTALEHTECQRIPALEEFENRGIGEARLFGHAADRRLAQAVAHEQVLRRLEQGPLGRSVIFSDGAGIRIVHAR